MIYVKRQTTNSNREFRSGSSGHHRGEPLDLSQEADEWAPEFPQLKGENLAAKLTVSTGPCSRAMLNYQRVYIHIYIYIHVILNPFIAVGP